MLIRELEQRTGLERATIRYYEKEGFITPHREENGYRTYSNADLDMLLKIKLLRQLGIPLDRIRALQQGSTDFSEALAEQILLLEKQVKDANRAKEVCNDIRSAGVSFGALDAEYYLRELRKPAGSEGNWKPQPVPEFSRHAPVHPWKRFFARTADLAILDMVILFFVVVVLRVRPLNSIIYTVLGLQIVMYLLWIPIEGLLLHYWGTTPGKWIFGIRVESANGGHLSISNAMLRAWAVLCRGYGLTIPIYQYWRLYKGYRQYNDHGCLDWDTEWDTEIQFEYYYETSKKIRIACVAAAYLLLFGWYLSDSIKPVHRGENLTVVQIVENHNDLIDQLIEDASPSMYLLEDGSWNSINSVYGPNAIVIGSQAVGDGCYHYELEDGFVRSITYEQSWTDVFYLSPIGERTIVTIKSIGFAQGWLNLWNARSFENAINKALEENSGHFTYNNLEIIWTTESENCINTGSYFFTENESLPSSVNLKMEILSMITHKRRSRQKNWRDLFAERRIIPTWRLSSIEDL